jgi:hypothetical protein
LRQAHLCTVAGYEAGDPITAAARAFGAGYVEEDQSATMNVGKGNCFSGHAPSAQFVCELYEKFS